MFISTDAIVLKNTPYQETSIISRLFCKETGKISAILKGAKRKNNNLSGIIEPGNVINITFYDKPNLKLSKEVKLIKTYYNSRKILSHYYYTMAIVSLIDKLCMENQSYADLFNLSVNILDKMDEQSIDTELLFIYFLIHLNKYIGYEININSSTLSKDSNNRKQEDEILKYCISPIDTLHMIDMQMVNKLDLLNRLKIIIYRHMKHHVIDLNEIYSINMLKSINHERTSRSN